MDFETTFPLRVCLNLDRRSDRWEIAAEEFRQAGLAVERWPAVDGRRVKNRHGYSWPSRYGVSLTKRLVVRTARCRGAEAVFLFEDDVVLHPQWRERLAALHLPDDWGIFMLGCQHISRPQPVAPGLLRISAAVDNHAIGFRREWFERVLFTLRHGRDDARIWPHTASDRHLSALMQEVPSYVPWPNLAWQRKSVSDQTGKAYTLYDATGAQFPGRHLLTGLTEFWQPGDQAPAPEQSSTPWMHGEEMACLRSVLHPGMAVLEYGSGGITGEFTGGAGLWHAIEHDRDRYHRACQAAAENRVHVHYVPPEWSQENSLHPAQAGQFRTYVQKCLALGMQFDAVILDGRARVDCALQAARVMPPGGWLFFHDYFTRPRYLRRAAELLPLFRMVQAFRRTPQTMAVFRRRH